MHVQLNLQKYPNSKFHCSRWVLSGNSQHIRYQLVISRRKSLVFSLHVRSGLERLNTWKKLLSSWNRHWTLVKTIEIGLRNRWIYIHESDSARHNHIVSAVGAAATEDKQYWIQFGYITFSISFTSSSWGPLCVQREHRSTEKGFNATIL